MKHVVSFSGGRTSAYLVHLMEQKRKNEGWDVEYVFMDTGAEHEKTYDFVKDVVKHFNINLHILRSKINPIRGKGADYIELGIEDIGPDLSMFKSYFKKYGMPMAFGSACTEHLKLVPYRKFCDNRFGKRGYTTWLGIRADEPNRLGEKPGIKYLAEISDFTKSDVNNWWAKQPFDLELDDWLGNCVFCVKKGLNKLAVAAIQEPEKAEEWHAALMATDTSGLNRPNDKREWGKMFRGNNSLIDIKAIYHGKNAEEIISTMRVRRGCAIEKGESCEVFGCQGELS